MMSSAIALAPRATAFLFQLCEAAGGKEEEVAPPARKGRKRPRAWEGGDAQMTPSQFLRLYAGEARAREERGEEWGEEAVEAFVRLCMLPPGSSMRSRKARTPEEGEAFARALADVVAEHFWEARNRDYVIVDIVAPMMERLAKADDKLSPTALVWCRAAGRFAAGHRHRVCAWG